MKTQTENNETLNKIKDYREVIATFSQILKEENEALRNYDLQKVGMLYERKSRIVSAYRSLVAYFMKNAQALRETDEKNKAKLREESIVLDELLKENDVLLKTRMETSKSIMETIVNIAKVTGKANSTAYGAQGNYAPVASTKNAIAINRTL